MMTNKLSSHLSISDRDLLTIGLERIYTQATRLLDIASEGRSRSSTYIPRSELCIQLHEVQRQCWNAYIGVTGRTLKKARVV